MPELTANDAAFAIALHRYLVGRAKDGGSLTCLEARRIAAIATGIGVHSLRSAEELGFKIDRGVLRSLPGEPLARAVSCINKTTSFEQVRRLCHLLMEPTVAQVDGDLPGAYPLLLASGRWG